MRKIDIVKNYEESLNKNNEVIIEDYCPEDFDLPDVEDEKCSYKTNEDNCEKCWNEELSIEKILEFLKNKQEKVRTDIKNLHKRDRKLLDKIQELCPHKNTNFIDDEDLILWGFEKEEDRTIKCEDCGAIL